ncbi:receptor-type guanylate cyclase gcy-15-like isoform X5 [Macrobrachium nipponense]|uniref:receptor-type guanylate cyclase gcy-15-like isoform X5 n=1 Tax=Macrobrachium nipponense TaxID=159736 RepID=UPI0030C7F775
MIADDEGETQSGASGSSLEEITLVSIRYGWFYFNPVSKNGRALHLVQMLVLPFIPIIALLTQNFMVMNKAFNYRDEITAIANQVQDTVDIGQVLRALQMERAEVAYYVLSNASAALRMNLSSVFDRTDRKIESVVRWPELDVANTPRGKMFKSRVRFQIRLEDFRDSIDPYETKITKVVWWYNNANSILLSVLVSRINDADASNMWREEIINNQPRNSSLEAANNFLQETAAFLDSVREVESTLVVDIREKIAEDLDRADRQYTLALVVLVVVLVISPIIILLVRKATGLVHSYASNLLSKSVEVKREKRKSDNLLYQLLPRTVAHYLKQSKQVPAEFFESVTIYLSDIVGFTRISSESSPLQVVMLLNTLYKQFDTNIEKFDVYKMETIGDAYMVVSGLPNRNGDRHASEVAEMSLVLLDMVSKFEFLHKKGEMLQVRIGIHSGPCVAGVVGTKMPRYCMFGKTITTAHFMESSGKPMKIHVSETTHKLLAKTEKYNLEFHRRLQVVTKYRAQTQEEVEIDTYWLLGRKSSTNPIQSVEIDKDQTPAFLQYITESEEAKALRHMSTSKV